MGGLVINGQCSIVPLCVVQDEDNIEPLVDWDQLLDLPFCDEISRETKRRQRRTKRKAYNFETDPERRWQMPVPYTFQSGFSEG